MADNVQWIKLKVGMFDGSSFKKIKRATIGGVSYRDKLTSVWFELMDLAGKSNQNGMLIDSNEIPYSSFDDIAIMLDRDADEIRLCMQFFINEKMVEIIDDVYCLSNFIKYQNQDGLERIREQRRISQAKWRERKKQGLIGYSGDVDSTVESTSILPSNSISISTISDNISLLEKENKKKKGFVAPTLEEIEEYVQERNSPVDPKQFYEYFNAGNWVDSKGNKVKNWKQKLITWEKFAKDEAKESETFEDILRRI